MSKKAKLLERIGDNPRGAKFSEVQQLLKDVGFSERQPKGGSSHYAFGCKVIRKSQRMEHGE